MPPSSNLTVFQNVPQGYSGVKVRKVPSTEPNSANLSPCLLQVFTICKHEYKAKVFCFVFVFLLSAVFR